MTIHTLKPCPHCGLYFPACLCAYQPETEIKVYRTTDHNGNLPTGKDLETLNYRRAIKVVSR